MTRRGTLVYYLTAWVCGCFFASLVVWLLMEGGGVGGAFRGSRGFFSVYFLSLMFGAIPAVLFAFLLRWLTGVFGWKHLVSWLVAGAGVAPLLAWSLAEADKALGSLVVKSSVTPREPLFWMTIPMGAATAFVLHLIERAFEPRPQ